MVQAKCLKCGGSAIADTFEKARQLINHAVGLSRKIKCGDNYNMVQEINSEVVRNISKPETVKPVVSNTPNPETSKLTPKPEVSKSVAITPKPKEKSKSIKSSV